MEILNLTVNNKNLRVFMNTFNLDSLINKPTYFQSANPTCVDLILTNKKSLFKNSKFLEVGISDHHSSINYSSEKLVNKWICKNENV